MGNKRINKGDTLRSGKALGRYDMINKGDTLRSPLSGSVGMTDKGEIILNVITVIGVVLFIWGFLSYIDIVSHNLTTQSYSPYNMWEIILKIHNS